MLLQLTHHRCCFSQQGPKGDWSFARACSRNGHSRSQVQDMFNRIGELWHFNLLAGVLRRSSRHRRAQDGPWSFGAAQRLQFHVMITGIQCTEQFPQLNAKLGGERTVSGFQAVSCIRREMLMIGHRREELLLQRCVKERVLLRHPNFRKSGTDT